MTRALSDAVNEFVQMGEMVLADQGVPSLIQVEQEPELPIWKVHFTGEQIAALGIAGTCNCCGVPLSDVGAVYTLNADGKVVGSED
jgi:hypothetical protein